MNNDVVPGRSRSPHAIQRENLFVTRTRRFVGADERALHFRFVTSARNRYFDAGESLVL